MNKCDSCANNWNVLQCRKYKRIKPVAIVRGRPCDNFKAKKIV